MCRAVFVAGLKTKQPSESTKGYQSSTTYQANNKKKIQFDKYDGGCIVDDNNDVIIDKVWKVLFPILNEANNVMKNFLKNMFEIKKYHIIITEMKDDKLYIIKLIENGHMKQRLQKKKRSIVIVDMQNIDADNYIGGSTTVTEKSENCTETDSSNNICDNDTEKSENCTETELGNNICDNETEISYFSRDIELTDNDTEFNEPDTVIEGIEDVFSQQIYNDSVVDTIFRKRQKVTNVREKIREKDANEDSLANKNTNPVSTSSNFQGNTNFSIVLKKFCL